jgi:hypothetical protein
MHFSIEMQSQFPYSFMQRRGGGPQHPFQSLSAPEIRPVSQLAIGKLQESLRFAANVHLAGTGGAFFPVSNCDTRIP